MFNLKPIIFIYVDALRRDLLVANVLKIKLEKKFSVYLVSRSNYKRILKLVTPDIYIIIKNFLKNMENDIADTLKKAHTIVIDSEGAMNEERANFHLEHMAINLDKILPYIKKSFVWNENFKKFINKHVSHELNKIEVVGSSKVSLSFLCNKLKFPKRNKKIGFVGRFGCINNFNLTTALETSITRIFEVDEYRHGAIGELKVLEIYINLIKKILSETNYNISIRPHPNEYYDSWNILKKMDKRIEISEKYSDFLEWMNEQDVIITTPSTSMVEPLLNQIPIISIHKISDTSGLHAYYEDMLRPFRDNAIIPNNFEEIIELLNKNEIKNPDFSAETNLALKNYYNIDSENGKNAISKIIQYINTVETLKTNILKKIYTSMVYFTINFYEYFKITLKKNKISSNYNFNYFIHNQEDKFAKKLSDLDDRL